MSRPRLIAVAAVLLLALWVLGPASLDPAGRFVGSAWLDAYGTQWFYWWTTLQLEETDPGALLFFPWGKDLYRHTGGNLLDATLAAPLRLLLGAPAGTNLFVLLILLGNAWGGERLAAAAGAGRPGRLAAAGLGLLHPFALFELQQGRFTQAMLLFPSLLLAGMLRPPTLGRALWGGLWLALSGLTYWYYGMVGALVVGAMAVVRTLGGLRDAPVELGRMLLLGLVSALMVAPFALPMVADLDAGAVPGLLALADEPGALGRLRLRTVEGDEQGLFVLALSGRGGALIEPAGLRFDPGVRLLGLAQGLALLGGLAFGLRRQRRPLLAAALVSAVVACGPVLILGRDFLANPLYLLGVEHLAVLRRWWWPGRASAFLGLGLVALGGLGVAGLRRRLGPRAAWTAAALLWATAIAGPASQALAPLDMWSAAVSPGIHCLAAAPPGAIIELPYALGQRPLYHQTIHGKPILNGMLVTKEAFAPAEVVAFRKQNRVIALLIALGERDWRHPRDAWTAEDLREVQGLGYRYVVFRKEGYLRPRPQRDGSLRMESDWPRAVRILREVSFLGMPSWEDEELALYTLDGSTLSCPDAPPP